MKKLFSKKTGFTLAEILVAFMVFAIMAAMVLQILRLAVAQRNSNQEFANEMDAQGEMLVRADKSRTYTDANKDGTISLKFSDALSVNLDYEMRAAYGEVYDEASGTNVFNGDEYGLNYFVADVDYAGNGLISNEEVTTMGSSGSQASRMDTRLTGTRNITSIDVLRVVQDSTNPNRYFIEVKADGSSMNSEDVPYAQFRMFFYRCGNVEGDDYEWVDVTDKDGNVLHQKKVIKKANIVDLGYCNNTTYTWSDTQCVQYQKANQYTLFTMNKYRIEPSASNGVRIGTPYTGSPIALGTDTTVMYVEFDCDPKLTVESFGSNVIAHPLFDYSRRYTAYPMLDEDGNQEVDDDGNFKYLINIYGGYEFETREAP